jgi:SOS-response transcriptional repressor LexA
MTPKQAAILNAIKALTKDGVSPSYAEIGAYMGGVSKGNIFRHLQILQKEGKIVMRSNSARSIHLIEDDTYSRMRLEQLEDETVAQIMANCRAILIARIAAKRAA